MLKDRLFMTRRSGLDSGLVVWYTMDSISGSTLIDSAGTYNGTMQNSPAQVAGKVGSALSFNGVNQFVDISSAWGAFPVSNTDFTLACWAKHNSTVGQQDIIGLFQYSAGGFRLVADGSVMYAQLSNGSGNSLLLMNPSITTGVWSHYLITFEPGVGIKGYINGVPVANLAASWAVLASGYGKIGAESSAGGTAARFFSGLIDDVRIYNRALSDAEVSDLFSLA